MGKFIYSGGKFKGDPVTVCKFWRYTLNSEADNFLSTSDC